MSSLLSALNSVVNAGITANIIDVDRVIGLPTTLEITAITLGALSGALHATRNRLDPTGIFAIALVCGVGGGVIRDVLLQRGVPVFLSSGSFLQIALFAAVVGFFFAGAVHAALPVMLVVDTALIGVWVLIGAEKALSADLPASTAVLMGVVTSTGGGLLRDVMCRNVPPALIRPGEWYGFAAIIAAVCFVALLALGTSLQAAEFVTIAVAAATRALSLALDIRTPTAYDIWAGFDSHLLSRLTR